MITKTWALTQHNLFLMQHCVLSAGGRIDHAHHANAAHKAMMDTIALQDAVQEAVDKTDQSDTLIVVTADHSHAFTFQGYPSLDRPAMGKNDQSLPWKVIPVHSNMMIASHVFAFCRFGGLSEWRQSLHNCRILERAGVVRAQGRKAEWFSCSCSQERHWRGGLGHSYVFYEPQPAIWIIFLFDLFFFFVRCFCCSVQWTQITSWTQQSRSIPRLTLGKMFHFTLWGPCLICFTAQKSKTSSSMSWCMLRV